MGLFKKKAKVYSYDKEHMKPVIKTSICTGEQVAGFKDIHTGKIEDIMLVKTSADIEKFKEMYGIEGNIDKALYLKKLIDSRKAEQNTIKKTQKQK